MDFVDSDTGGSAAREGRSRTGSGGRVVEVSSSSQGTEKKPIGRNWKRRYARYRIDLPITATVLGEDGYRDVSGRSGDLGEGGLGAVLVSEISQGEVIDLAVQLPNGRELEVRGIVRYRKGLLHGLEFLGLSEEQRQAIKRLCEHATELD